MRSLTSRPRPRAVVPGCKPTRAASRASAQAVLAAVSTAPSNEEVLDQRKNVELYTALDTSSSGEALAGVRMKPEVRLPFARVSCAYFLTYVC